MRDGQPLIAIEGVRPDTQRFEVSQHIRLNAFQPGHFLDLESSMVVTLHIQSIDQSAAIKNVKRKITDLQKMTIEEQKKAVRSGYDMDIIPSDLATYGAEAKTLLEDLQCLAEKDLPLPGVPRIRPLGFLSCLRSARIRLLERAFRP